MFVTLIYCDDGESNSRTVCPKTGCRVQNCRQAVRLKRVVVVVPTKKKGTGRVNGTRVLSCTKNRPRTAAQLLPRGALLLVFILYAIRPRTAV